MDLEFEGKTKKFVVIYLYDLTIFSHCHEHNLKHLRKVFDRCKKFGISLNPKMSLFALQEGKLLSHIISKEGVVVDPKGVSTIQALILLRNKKEVQAFLVKIIFLRRLIPNYVEIVKDINHMMKKNHEVKWNIPTRYAFDHIKKAIA